MSSSHRPFLGILFPLFALVCAFATAAVENRSGSRVLVSEGWHPWYQVKADPEDPANMIICGTKWDARLNAAFGFIYASSNGGSTWQLVLEDRNSAWVTEQSCAFGPSHRAYFISEASKVEDGELNHHLGRTRLYVSTDGGQRWAETAKTGWADFSTSAVSSASHRLYTFFNATKGELRKTYDVGLLVFSPDGKSVTGPFFDSADKAAEYNGIYPSDAVTLNSGAVVALYYGVRQRSPDRSVELGVIRADGSKEPSMRHVPIVQRIVASDCLNFLQGSLAYDPERNEMFVFYVDGCKDTKLVLASSKNEGRTWTEITLNSDFQNPTSAVTYPSLVACAAGDLGLLWDDGLNSGRWLFSYIRNRRIGPPRILFPGSTTQGVSPDSLWTAIEQANDRDTPLQSSITLNVRNERNGVWRANGLAFAGNRIVAVWPSEDSGAAQLYLSVLAPDSALSNEEPPGEAQDGVQHASYRDITRNTAMLYGGSQQFDDVTKTLKVCLTLQNRGRHSIRVPIKLQVTDVRSPAGTIAILGSANGLAGIGALLDISDSVTGDQIPPNTASNPFCLSLHLIPKTNVPSLGGDDLVELKLRVLASTDRKSQE